MYGTYQPTTVWFRYGAALVHIVRKSRRVDSLLQQLALGKDHALLLPDWDWIGTGLGLDLT